MSTEQDELRAELVRRAARDTAPWAPSSSKVFVSDLYDTLVRQGVDDGMTIDEIKAILVDLHRKGLIVLSRADLVAAMPQRKVAESEIDARGATFHFVRQNPPEDFEAEIERMRQKHAARLEAVESALAKSPAIIVTHKDGRRELYLLTPEMSSPQDGAWRLTCLMPDGPWGHDTRRTVRDLAEEVARSHPATVTPASEDEVVMWTETEEFVRGAKRVAFIQAVNAIRDHATTMKAHEIFDRDPDEGIRFAEIAARGGARQNPGRGPILAARRTPVLISNPAWVTRVVGDRLERIETEMPPRWMPRLSSVRVQRGRVSARLRELGCGAYGCVLPTLDDHVVMKITTDETEAQFAGELADKLVAKICVEYLAVWQTTASHSGRPVFFLWRESADRVGQIGKREQIAVSEQHAAAQVVYAQQYHDGKATPAAMRTWRDAVKRMMEYEDLEYLARGLLMVYDQQQIFFGDIHHGNLGIVVRDGHPYWVITDPGHVSVAR